MQAKCPKCSWNPSPDTLWNCECCGYVDQFLDKAGECTQCGFLHQHIFCIEWEGGCGESSQLLDWFPDLDSHLAELNITRSPD